MKTFFASLLSILGIFAISSASAQALYWDPGQSGGTAVGGSGNWDSTDPFWYNGSIDAPWVSGNDAYFTNTAGTVTLTGSLAAADIYFTNVIGNYVITNDNNGETLTIDSVIDTGGSEDIIGTPLANSGNLTKNGAGRLHLCAANSSLNNVIINQGYVSMEYTNTALGGSATVAAGASLEVNGGTSNLLEGIDGVDNLLTISGTGVANDGALRSVAGLNTWLEKITLAGNTTINVNTNSAFLYDGSDSGAPMTDNGNNYNLTITGPFGNVQFINYGLTIGGSVLVGPGADCIIKQGTGHAVSYVSSFVSAGGTLEVHSSDTALGTVPASFMTTNIILDGGILNGYGNNNWTMSPTRAITITTNGGTVENTDSGSTWTTTSIYDPSNAPFTLAGTGTAIIQVATANNTNVMNLGTATLTCNGGSIKLTGGGTSQYTFSNLCLINGNTYSFNYEVGGATSPGLGSIPNALSISNIFISGSSQLHVGHSTTLNANRGIYVANGTAVIEDTTSSGTVTINGPISGPGSMSFPLGKSGSTTAIVLAGNNTYTGTTTVGSSCTVTVSGGSGTLGTGNTTDSGTLTFSRSGSYTYGGAISGAGVVNNTGSGSVTLTGPSTYTGATTLTAGTFVMNNTNASAIAVNSGGTLAGTGVFGGTITVASGGTLALGTGTLSASNNVTLSGKVTVSLNKSLSPTSGNAIVQGTLTGSGTVSVIVTNLGPALAVGDTFTLFNKGISGSATINVTGGGSGVTWNNNLASSGTISVATVPAAGKPVINSVQVSGGNFIFSGTNGTAGTNFIISTSTNLLLPTPQWTPLSTNPFQSNGTFSFTNAVNPGTPVLFYLLQVQ
jgi:fibronectin-binding autotransporter adhesin